MRQRGVGTGRTDATRFRRPSGPARHANAPEVLRVVVHHATVGEVDVHADLPGFAWADAQALCDIVEADASRRRSPAVRLGGSSGLLREYLAANAWRWTTVV